jgi:hypothetical protein
MDSNQEMVHRRRLAQILRYIASMHTALNGTVEGAASGNAFVRDGLRPGVIPSDFFRREQPEDDPHWGVLFSTESFRALLAIEQDQQPKLFATPPFTFYAAAAGSGIAASSSKMWGSTSAHKRSFTDAFPAPFKGSPVAVPEKACWLRITRLTTSQLLPPPLRKHPAVRQYLQDWCTSDPTMTGVDDVLTLRRLEQAPKIAPTVDLQSRDAIKSFLRRTKRYLRQKSYQNTLEPLYNRLFEWQQQNDQDELVWGLGHAKVRAIDGVWINGPLLEVQMEVELARDGALLVRPREHTGVSLNRDVLAALGTWSGEALSHVVLSQLHRTVAELESCQLSPAQPNTYTPLLKRMAVELSSGGSFQSSSVAATTTAQRDPEKLVVTEAWCVFARPKPSSVWARDANTFADQIMQGLENPLASVELPKASWSLTLGPGSLDTVLSRQQSTNSKWSRPWVRWISEKVLGVRKSPPEEKSARPLFPLPTSDAQNKIAELLLTKNYPAVVCEGPPGTGKSHSIANLICAYLCQGKRVLVTSKKAPALSVLRNRLPVTVQELCVDVSRSELAGMQQLQQTVERLANRVASASAVLEAEKCKFLQRNIDEHEAQLKEIDAKLVARSEKVRKLMDHPKGQSLVEISMAIIDSAPWLARTISGWTVKEVSALRDVVVSLLLKEEDPARSVTGFSRPPTDALISRVAAEAGHAFPLISNAVKGVAARIPMVGSLTGIEQRRMTVEEALMQIRINGQRPSLAAEWHTVLRALNHAKALHSFETITWRTHESENAWPHYEFADNIDELFQLKATFDDAVAMKSLAWNLDLEDETNMAVECRALDTKRRMIATRILGLAEDLVDASVITELSRSFSTDAQSALIRFAQIAGKAKFSRTSQPSKMTQRQRRRRQEYLDAFDRCCRFIPCWILTASQISDYLPSECLFDLVVIDEASQSDIRVLPGMLRGKQWLIVGDGKQVSPTEAFVSEEQIDALRAALPPSPLEDSLLPGQSFFDLCAQAFPQGRVVLSEHFRCAEEIIDFSNQQFYDGRLVPLRLPTKSERLTPSLVDVMLLDGVKIGKVNEKEADEIVRMIQDFTSDLLQVAKPRSIGVISLIGDEQSRLIRGRLLDTIGPRLMARHDILVGDPPTFQGAERDIIFLSMVCSRGAIPTQNQLMHVQRANVAMSRAKDRCVLVRSVNIHEIPSSLDVKVPIIEFFQRSAANFENRHGLDEIAVECPQQKGALSIRLLLTKLLRERGFTVRDMGIVWKEGLCVEHPASDRRAALLVDCAGEPLREWLASYSQEKAIQRVGWVCLRVDALSFLHDFHAAFQTVVKFLSSVGIEESAILYDELDDDQDESIAPEAFVQIEVEDPSDDDSENLHENIDLEAAGNQMHDVVMISSDEEDTEVTAKKPAAVKAERVASESLEIVDNEEVDPSDFGQVVDMSFLRGASMSKDGDDDENNDFNLSVGSETEVERKNEEKNVARRPSHKSNELKDGKDKDEGDTFTLADRKAQSRVSKRRRYHRVDKYSRDGRWYPAQQHEGEQDDEHKWYDTDSDMSVHKEDALVKNNTQM